MSPSLLEQLSAGALDWLGGNLDHFDPFAPAAGADTRSTPQAKAKAALELGLLCHRAARPAGGGPPPPRGGGARPPL
ncbi:DUF6895 family protein [Streptomyces sp. NPDC059810]|uniref:DUF6895 family protein n=1 Tax=Streptomyces sp. NPDC059810 TaxID=3346956 RepID=UPI003653148D